MGRAMLIAGGGSMEPQMILAQAVGAVGMTIAILAYQCKDNRRLFATQIAAAVVLAIHYLLLNAMTGLLMNMIGVVRLFFLYNGKKKWARHPAAMIGVMALFVVGGAFTYNGWLSILATAATALGTPFYWRQNGKTLRYAQLGFISPCWLIYDIAFLSIPGIITESFAIVSVIISLIRFRGVDQITPDMEK